MISQSKIFGWGECFLSGKRQCLKSLSMTLNWFESVDLSLLPYHLILTLILDSQSLFCSNPVWYLYLYTESDSKTYLRVASIKQSSYLEGPLLTLHGICFDEEIRTTEV